MNGIGSHSNIQNPDSRCFKCKYFKRTTKEILINITIHTIGHCGAGYCKMNKNKKKGI